MDWSKVAGDLNRLTKEIDDARRALRARVARQGSGRSGIARATAPWPAVERLAERRSATWFAFYDGYDPLFTWWMQEPYKAADQALQAYAGFLRQRFGARRQGIRRRIGGAGPGRRPRRRRAAPASRDGDATLPARSRRPRPPSAQTRDRRHADRPRGAALAS